MLVKIVDSTQKSILYYVAVILCSVVFLIIFSLVPAVSAQTPGDLFPGDVNEDFKVNLTDLSILLANFGKSPATRQEGNVSPNDTIVNLTDLSLVLSNFGKSFSPTATPTPTRTPTPTSTSGRTRVIYTPSTEEIANPERGFMKQSNIFLDQAYSSKLGKQNPNDTVVWIYFHMEKYRDPRDGKGVTVSNYQFVPLEPVGSGKGLDVVKKTFDDARTKGLKLVIRFLYVGYSGIGSTQDFANAEPDAPLDVTLKHIDQLAPLIQQNKDVILAVQAGFVGYWGEWHSSKYLSPVANRKAIVDKLLAVVPQDRMLQVRYPKYVQNLYGGPISAIEAFNQSNVSRVGIHDDAFLKDDTDDGTFTSNAMGQKISTYCDGSSNTTQCWRGYYAKTSQYTPAGGEAGTHSNPPSPLANCPNALTQLNNLHFSFLHNGYAKVVLDTWVNQGCMPEIRRRLGYRLVLKEALIPQSVRVGGTLNLDVTLSNEGFASMFNPRPVFIVLQNASNRYEIPVVSVDPRRWEAGREHTVIAAVTIPSNVSPGTYTLGLWLPDQATSLRGRPAYSVRFANTNVWEPATGINRLTNNFQVTN